jgi:Ca-activated chloride channel homolog
MTKTSKNTTGLRNRAHRLRNRQGAMLVLVAASLVIFLVCLVFSVDIAFMHLARTELRTTVDAAARSAAKVLSEAQDVTAARSAGQATALRNKVAGRGFRLPDADLVFGRVAVSTTGISNFVAGVVPPNAVRVTSGRTGSRPDGPVSLLFGRILGRSSFEPVQTSVAAQLDRDVALVLDVSGSMADDNKFVGLQAALNVFLTEIDRTPQSEHVSLTTYSTTSRRDQALTPNSDLIRSAFATKRPNGSTAIGLGLRDGLASLQTDRLRRSFAEHTVIVMTDGIHNTGVTPDVIARTAPRDVTIHTITFGRDAEQGRMQLVAAIGRGQHFHAANNQDLIRVFRQLALTLPVVLVE